MEKADQIAIGERSAYAFAGMGALVLGAAAVLEITRSPQ